MTEPWTTSRIPRLDDRIAVVTGANTGIGFETARALARAGAKVVLACRSEDRGEDARRAIAEETPTAEVSVERLDLGDLAQVAVAAEGLAARLDRVDILVNNAGVMTPPASRTTEGFELQFGVNHLGHFALTGRLMPLLSAAPAARVVCVSSIAHLGAKIDFDNLRLEKPYQAWREYKQSKLANLAFAIELDRRLQAAGSPVRAVAAHPGVSHTELQRHYPAFMSRLSGLVLMPAWKGALPSLYAATEPVEGGSYTGPGGWREIWGWPAPARIDRSARDPALGARLFEASEALTGVDFDLAPASTARGAADPEDPPSPA